MTGKYQYDLEAKRVQWFGLVVKQVREPGELIAGIDTAARVEVLVSPLDRSEHLADEALKGLVLDPSPDNTRLFHQAADGTWTVTYDRRWHLNFDEPQLAIFRLFDPPDRLAMCRVFTMAKADAEQFDLRGFQEQVGKALKAANAELIEADEIHAAPGYRVFRVAMKGTVSDLPICWHYYLVSDGQGHQIVLAFTLVAELMSRIANADRQLATALRFTAPKAAAK